MIDNITSDHRKGRFIVLILDGYGVGATADAHKVRPADVHTCKHIFDAVPGLRLPNMQRLGLGNVAKLQLPAIDNACYAEITIGKCALQHYGADTFYGHQEIMGTLPRKPNKRPFSEVLPEVRVALEQAGYSVEIKGDKLHFLWVDGCVAIADNIEADPGSAYNITATFDHKSFAEVLAIGKIVRAVVDVSRVIAFGGVNVHPQRILAAEQHKDERFVGINAPLSGVYDEGYLVQHLGYGIDAAVQVPAMLRAVGVRTALVGKVADIVSNANGLSYSVVDTRDTLECAVRCIREHDHGFICINVQETDIAGHLQDAELYADKLRIADEYISVIQSLMNEDDILIVTADHGNDPTIGHSGHTRENTPLLMYGNKLNAADVGTRNTMSDIGATVCAYFDAPVCENGTSFLQDILTSSLEKHPTSNH